LSYHGNDSLCTGFPTHLARILFWNNRNDTIAELNNETDAHETSNRSIVCPFYRTIQSELSNKVTEWSFIDCDDLPIPYITLRDGDD
jgi:hypothetical protein